MVTGPLYDGCVSDDLSDEAREYFRRIGKASGASGGRKAAQNMTPEQRAERARKAAAKSAQVRSAKSAAKKKPVMPNEVLEFFRSTGHRGGKRSLETMTEAERVERARLAGIKSGEARRVKAAAKKNT